MKHLPELLSPAGTPEAFCAAVDAGADAIYLGVGGFNARANARNLSIAELASAIKLAHTVGVRCYVTLNTLLFDREYRDMLRVADDLYLAGADALIVADLGAAALLRKNLPDLPLHASTQCAVHSLDGAKVLQKLGFTRLVPARELSLADIRHLTESSPLETEIFIHGALCVSHSGQCLFSSLVGGRSGNRGECAQPCRMQYGVSFDEKARPSRTGYPLSLKDLSLAPFVTDVIASGVHSLKIEGRMKSPYYVREVTSTWRRLLDEERNAGPDEMAHLAEVFSRQGFTDAYFTAPKISVSLSAPYLKMNGIRDENTVRNAPKGAPGTSSVMQRYAQTPRSQKQAQMDTLSESSSDTVFRTARRRNITLEFSTGLDAADCFLSATALPTRADEDPVSVLIKYPAPSAARDASAALTKADAVRSLSKLGGTLFTLADMDSAITVTVKDSVFIPASVLNGIRRQAVEALEGALCPERRIVRDEITAEKTTAPRNTEKTEPSRLAVFSSPDQVTDEAVRYFSPRMLTFEALAELVRTGKELSILTDGRVDGIAMPPVILDSEKEKALELLSLARSLDGCRVTSLLVTGPSQLGLFSDSGLDIYLDYRFNVGSSETVKALHGLLDAETAPIRSVTLSPELTLPQIRDVIRDCRTPVPSLDIRVMTYGRATLMTLERCIMRAELLPKDKSNGRLTAVTDCTLCRGKTGYLRDRTDTVFPILREWQHRNLILNSLPVSMTDRRDLLTSNGIQHEQFVFTVESPNEVNGVILAHKNQRPLPGAVRRIAKK
ncbi:MAG: U32 family peptidase [Clostridia bacterium]|nr:U32 family peptidase [Clostridia bacterium]